MGMHGWKHVNRAIQTADLLIAIGMRFDDRVTGNVRTYAPVRPDHPRRHRPGRDRQERRRRGARSSATPKRVLRALTADGRRRRSGRPRRTYFDQLAEWQRDSESRPAGTAPGAWRDGLLSADYVVERIGELTDHDATYVADVGQNQMWLARYTGFRDPNSHVSSGGLGTMGFSVPAAMGAALGRPDRETWAITGDGGFQMTFQELMTLVADHIPVKIALFDNKKLGMIRQWQEIIYAGNYHSANLPGPGLREARRRVRHPGVPGAHARRGRRRHPGRAGRRRPGAHLVRDRRGAERLPDDARRQGPVRPHREVGRGGRMSADPDSNGQLPADRGTAGAARPTPRRRRARCPAAASTAATCSSRSS